MLRHHGHFLELFHHVGVDLWAVCVAVVVVVIVVVVVVVVVLVVVVVAYTPIFNAVQI